MVRSTRLVILYLFYFLYITTANDISDIAIKNAERSIDISSQLVKITTKLTFENLGKSPLKTVLYGLESSDHKNLAFISAKDSSNKELKLAETPLGGQDDKFYKVELKEALNPGNSVTLNFETVFSKLLVPFPTEITQQEHQLVKYYGNLYIYSPYNVQTQKTTISVGVKGIETFSKFKPYTSTESTITYGPIINTAPFIKKAFSVHYKNDSPFMTVSRVERTIEVSHWGNIAVEEIIKVHHSGAKLKGSFSRFDYQQDAHSGPSSVKSYKTLLPASAADVYYRDTNGNISTSNMRIKKDAVEVDLRPRYPLFGGWKSHYTLGYNVPSYEYLFYSGSDYLLKMRIIDHIFDDMEVEEVVTKIILPEGTSNFKLQTPYPVKRLPDTLHYTYLDTKGRPVISFTKTNVCENHIQDFQLRYTFPRLLMLQEPLLVVGFLFSLFFCVIIYMRLDFSIQKERSHKD